MEILNFKLSEAASNPTVNVVSLEGVLDFSTFDHLDKILHGLFSKKEFKIVLNFEKVTYISSAGFGVLISVIKEVRKNRGDIKISNVDPKVFQVFEMLELPGLFHILKNEQEAVNAFGEAQGMTSSWSQPTKLGGA